MDGYHIQTIIDTAEAIGNGILDLCEKARDVIDSFNGQQEEETEIELKEEEQQWW